MSGNKRNLNVALKLTANTKDLVKGLDVADKGLGDVEKAAKALGKSGKAALEPLADSVAKVGKETEKLGKKSKTALAPIPESVKKIAKSTDALGKTNKSVLAPMPPALDKIAKASNRAGESLEKSARRGANAWERMGRVVKSELNTLSRFKDSIYGQMTGLGLGFGVGASVVQSAQLDKGMTQLQLTTGGSQLQTSDLRKNLLSTQTLTGQNVDRLKMAADALGAGGLSMSQINGTITPLAKTMAVSTTDPAQLAKAASVASTFFDVDLTKPEEAEKLFDKMTVAGREGFAELENLPDIFARVGTGAKAAGLGLDQTLAMVETLSKYEPNSERLATLVDSTLRVFTNANYLSDAQSGTGVRFYEKNGARRDPMAVIGDMKVKWDKLKTDKQRAAFIDAGFGKADQDTRKGMQMLFDVGSLDKFKDVEAKVAKAQGTIQRDFEAATDNAVDQLVRLTGALRTTTDMLSGPVNKAFTDLVKKALAPKDQGGYGLTGGDLMGGAAATAAGLYVAGRVGGAAVKKVVGSLGGLTKGVTVGKALEETVGVTPVYVVNMPDSFGGSPTAAVTGADLSGVVVKHGGGFWSQLRSLVAKSPTQVAIGGGLLATGGTALNYGVNGLMDAGASALTGDKTNFNTMMLDFFYGKKTPAMGAPGEGIKQIGEPWSGSGNFGDRIAEALKRAVTNSPSVPSPLLKPQEVGGTITLKIENGKARVSELKTTGGIGMNAVYTGQAMGG